MLALKNSYFASYPIQEDLVTQAPQKMTTTSSFASSGPSTISRNFLFDTIWNRITKKSKMTTMTSSFCSSDSKNFGPWMKILCDAIWNRITK